ncbi:biotin-dependent carboxyltransferase family protein [Spongiivirga sp. MCCC 1A20706]|uniref:5-oxoprolinase subunit C family protein n=1 Tax=Spongiivirga sp. MCCC 1A20706 TaxID=3160963 RepID=UPI003977BB90
MIKVLHPGFLSSFQDMGRFGYRHFGVPVSGAMDQQSMVFANKLVGNPNGEAVIEFAIRAPRLKFETNTRIAITGADFSPLLNKRDIQMNISIEVAANDELSFKGNRKGVYGYIALSGGYQLRAVMNSHSYYSNISDHLRLQKGVTVALKKSTNKIVSSMIADLPSNKVPIKVYKGPEFKLLSKHQQEALLTINFSISNIYNRMGIQLEEKIENSLPSILTFGVLPGTVQLTPSGTLIVLMRDAQTTGGYPRVLQLTENAVNSISQFSPGTAFKFEVLT